ncbi:hypothetical protein [Clostridium cylindrosporum]|uniref:Uncharacterized protein n=1 Tax=Clostridium cylindrosporum DSM 605 TaxID=1121307 RepID=A0A0J8DDA9_CLOCY|nr:hypothetical protein [Clostridium cylindrosporum]KMT22224.1 hypothetical protein CLCY_4c01970 [Clostridium cylindrosporum DSM 605]
MDREKSFVNKVKDSLNINGSSISEAAERIEDKIEGTISSSVSSVESSLNKVEDKLKGNR